MENNDKIVKLLEEIRDIQKANFERALEMQKRAQKKLFWPLFLLVALIVLSIFLR